MEEPHQRVYERICHRFVCDGGGGFFIGASAVRDFSRHKSYEVLRFYDDNRETRGAEVAKLVAAGVDVI